MLGVAVDILQIVLDVIVIILLIKIGKQDKEE